ncbi:FAD dependent oxidoreductase [Geopyxis carbonaria]|nr:FAD dependent oxidoreductase [Geopyxis carbonaria]
MGTPPKKICVLGAGIIGLQSALTLLECGYDVTIIAEYWPGDSDINYTSPRAGAHWRSQGVHDERFDRITYQHWHKLVQSGEHGTGIEMVTSYHFWELETDETVNNFSGLWWRDLVQDFHILDAVALPPGCKSGVSYKAFAINPTVYMQYLMGRCQVLGAKYIKTKVQSVDEVFTILGSVIAVVNCTGISAGVLSQDPEVYPIKGQTVLVKGQCSAIRFRQTQDGWQDVVIRRPGEGSVLGVSKDKGDWSHNVDAELTKKILARCKELAPELLVDGEFEILSEQVGRRPSRTTGVRIEIEHFTQVDGQSKIICHHYGHAGGGFQNSIGSAHEVAQLLRDALNGNKV